MHRRFRALLARLTVGRVAVGAVTIIGVLALSALPAGAHAVLLRTTPSPQSTVARAPSVVRLEFSELVQAVFGAVRVYDVNGKRVDNGTARHPDGAGEILEAPLSTLSDGTYTVTWRVVSADGHAVNGGFVFYVGAPSSISPVAISSANGTSAAVPWLMGTARFVWFFALALLVGAVVTRRWVFTPAARAADAPESAARYRASVRRALPAAWLVVFVAGALTLGLEAARISGLSLTRSFAWSSLHEVLGTTFGHLWIAQMLLTLVLAIPVIVLSRRHATPLVSSGVWTIAGGCIAGALLVVVALNGHARTASQPAVAVSSIAIHLGAMSVWVGGLVALVLFGVGALRGAPDGTRSRLLRETLRRFSPIAIVGVLVLIATGTVNSVLGFDSISDLWTYAYGRVVLAKIVLVAIALAIASRHLLVLPRRPATASDDTLVRSFRLSSRVEAVVVIGALMLAAVLVDLVPGRTLALASNGPVNQQHTVGTYTVQLFLDPSAVGINEVHLTIVDTSGLAAAGVSNATATVSEPDASSRPLRLRLLAPGHLAGLLNASSPGGYRVDIEAQSPTGPLRSSFSFELKSTRQTK